MRQLQYVTLLIILFMILTVTALGQVSYTVKFSHSNSKWTTIAGEDAVQYMRLTLAQTHASGELGKPELPERYIRLIVPANQDVETIIVDNLTQENVSGEYKIYPVQHPVPLTDNQFKPVFEKPNQSVYSSDNLYPNKCVTVIRDGYFDGSNHIVTVAVYPYQYHPKSGKLVLNSSIDFTLKMKSGKSKNIQVRMRNEKNQKIYDKILNQSVDNTEKIGAYRAIPPLGKSGGIESVNQLPFYDYVIITSNALKPSFNAFVSWKTRKGLHVGVVTTEEIYADYSGDLISGIYDNAGKIRQYLSDAYQSGTVWALLAGDNDIVPTRYGCGWDVNSWTWDPNQPGDMQIPADLYYSDFNGDWDVNGGEWYGQPTWDDVDYNPEIFVGRVPCANATDVANWVEKVIMYETNPGNGDVTYLTKSFWIQGDNIWTHPDEISDNYPTTLDHTVWDQSTLHTGSQVVNEMSNQYGILNWYCHGGPTMFRVQNVDPYHSWVWTEDDYSLPYLDANPGEGLNNMTNTNYYSVVYSICCDIAAYDNYQQWFSAGRSMAEGFTTFYTQNCGPALLGNTRYGWQYEAPALHAEFADLLTLGTNDPESGESYLHLGVSEAVSKQNFYDHYTILTHNLFGCPETKIWTATPSTFSSVSVTDNGTSVTVNAGVSGCDISVTSGNNGGNYFLTAHNVTSYTFSTSVRPLYITVTRPNYIPHTSVTGGTFTSNENWFGNMQVLGSVVVNSGYTLAVMPGSNIKFNSGTSLTMQGILDAEGTISSMISFTPVTGNSAGSWGSIIFNGSGTNSSTLNYLSVQYGGGIQFVSGANPTIQNSHIEYCTQGFYISGSSPHIYYNTITNPSQNGIYGTAVGSWLEILSNKIERTTDQNYSGINLSNGGHGYVAQNDISGFCYGMYIGGGTYSDFIDANWYSYNPNNRIINCLYGMGVAWGSTVIMQNDLNGNNSIHDNTNLDLNIYSEGYLESYDNYWGGRAPLKYVSGDSYCSIVHNLPDDPWDGFEFYIKESKPEFRDSKPHSTIKKFNIVDSKDMLPVQESLSPLRIGLELLYSKQFTAAFDHFKNLLTNVTYEKIAANYLMQMSQAKDQVGVLAKDYIKKYLQNHLTNPTNLSLLIQLEFQEEQYDVGISLCDKLIKEFPNSYQANAIQFRVFNYLLWTKKDIAAAKDQLGRLKSQLNRNDDFMIKSDFEMADYAIESSEKTIQPEIKQVKTNEQITDFNISNYPNPFNPKTIIKYDLPSAGKVVLKVYDILGKEVATLVDNYKESGRYTVEFDASKLSSGMYIYRITTGSFSNVKKMMFVK